MTPKERAAMQQALEALHNTQNALLFVSGSIEQFIISNMTADAHDDADKAITALREALGNSLKPKCFADYQPNHAIDRACASCAVAVECQTGEQAEQEPKYFGLTHDHTWLSIDKKQYDKLKPEGRMACYTAPVRTKDLTDDEIADIVYEMNGNEPTAPFWRDLARAVIAADREKNK